jgi:hypothetical protein
MWTCPSCPRTHQYDAPIVRQLEAEGGKHDSAMANARVLQKFFATIKGHPAYIHLQFVTGVSRFGRTALFSGANQLKDISLTPRFSSVVGYTRPEIEAAFGPHLAALAAKEGLPDEELWSKIAAWYDGYNWGGDERIFNPWSIGNLLDDQQFRSYWPALGTPSWLVKQLLLAGLDDLAEQLGQYHNEAAFNKLEIDTVGRSSSWSNINLLFQTGFLSIADQKHGPDGPCFRLDFPNKEVKDAIARDLFGMVFSGVGESRFDKIKRLRQALDDNDVKRFYEVLDTGLRGVPFTTFKKNAAITNTEAHYSAMISMLLPFVLPKGYVVRAEDTTSDGQIDLVIETPSRIFLCEHKILPKSVTSEEKQARTKKLTQEAQEALDQIKRKGYAAKYRADSRPITSVGVCFDCDTRGVGHVLVEATDDRCTLPPFLLLLLLPVVTHPYSTSLCADWGDGGLCRYQREHYHNGAQHTANVKSSHLGMPCGRRKVGPCIGQVVTRARDDLGPRTPPVFCFGLQLRS